MPPGMEIPSRNIQNIWNICHLTQNFVFIIISLTIWNKLSLFFWHKFSPVLKFVLNDTLVTFHI